MYKDAYADIRGSSNDFRAHPVASLDNNVLIHDKHAHMAFQVITIDPPYNTTATSSQPVRITDTLVCFPVGFTIPNLSPLDHATAAIIDLASALRF